MEWPPWRSDLNHSEQLWDQLGHAVHARMTNTPTLADLEQYSLKNGMPSHISV